jgi:hypothetical protein
VVGVGIGEQTTASRPTGHRALKVYVEKKFPAAAISLADRLPATFAGLIVDVEEVGVIRLLAASAPTPLDGRALHPGQLVRIRSRSGRDECVATLGGFVRSGSRVLGLTTAHGPAESGEAAIQALAVASHEKEGTLAELERTTALAGRTVVDGSLWAIHANGSIERPILSVRLPVGIENAGVDMIVHKSGGTSGYTLGRVLSIDVDVRACAADRNLLFLHQLVIGAAGDAPFAVPGDSGSLIVNCATSKAVGLLVAGSSTLAIANHVEDVLDALGVRLVAEARQPPPVVAVGTQSAGERAPAPSPPVTSGRVPTTSGVIFKRLAP